MLRHRYRAGILVRLTARVSLLQLGVEIRLQLLAEFARLLRRTLTCFVQHIIGGGIRLQRKAGAVIRDQGGESRVERLPLRPAGYRQTGMLPGVRQQGSVKAAVGIDLEIAENGRDLRLHRKGCQRGEVQSRLFGHRMIGHVHVPVLRIGPGLFCLQAPQKGCSHVEEDTLGSLSVKEEGLLLEARVSPPEQQTQRNRQKQKKGNEVDSQLCH